MHRHLAVIVGLITVLTATASARAQETLADLGLSWSRLFTVADVDAIDAAAKLTPEQRTAIEDLMQAAMAKALEQTTAWQEKQQEFYSFMSAGEADAEKAKKDREQAAIKALEAHKALMNALLPMERETLSDVRGLLTSEQADRAWPAYERYRRSRVLGLLATVGTYGRGSHPRDLLRQLKVSDADRGAAKAIVEESDLPLDAVVRRLIEAHRAMVDATMRDPARYAAMAFEGEAEDESKQPEEVRRHDRAQRELVAEYVRTCGRMAAAMSPEGRRVLQHARIEREYPEYQMTQSWVGRSMVTSTYLSQVKTLTPEQKTALKDLEKAARDTIRDMLVPDLEARDAALVKLEKWTPPPERVKACTDAAAEASKKLEKDAQAVLTEDQRAEIDYRKPSASKLRKMFYSRTEPGEQAEGEP